jgi:hypothetical protein
MYREFCRILLYLSHKCPVYIKIIQGDQKVSVHLMITIHKVISNVQSVPASLQAFIDTRLTLTPSVILNCDYVVMVSV